MRRNTLESMPKRPKFRYRRPEFLDLKDDDDFMVSSDKQIRPIILPRGVSRLPWDAGYAECVNAGKSCRNEDQAAFLQDVIVESSHTEHDSECPGIPWVYFGIFDGHAGDAVAVAAASQLDKLIKRKLEEVADLLIALEFDSRQEEDAPFTIDEINHIREGFVMNERIQLEKEKLEQARQNNTNQEDNEKQNNLTDVTKDPMEMKDMVSELESISDSDDDGYYVHNPLIDFFIPDKMKMTADHLITGALEAAFIEMDALIANDKNEYHMPGGCTAVVSVFILGRLFVCNAGDSRAVVINRGSAYSMSYDHTPISDINRILRLAKDRPELLGGEFTHLQFPRRPTRSDLGKKMLYRDAFMHGWSMKTITQDDLKYPLVWGEGKRSRCLGTIGVSRGFGDHELKAVLGSVPIKPFLTAEPTVEVMDLEYKEDLTADDVLIMGTDGLWDVTYTEDVADVVRESFEKTFTDNEESRHRYRYVTAAQDLVLNSRGIPLGQNVWRCLPMASYGSMDDISVFVIPLKPYRDEYIEWKRVRMMARRKWKQRTKNSSPAPDGPSEPQ